VSPPTQTSIVTLPCRPKRIRDNAWWHVLARDLVDGALDGMTVRDIHKSCQDYMLYSYGGFLQELRRMKMLHREERLEAEIDDDIVSGLKQEDKVPTVKEDDELIHLFDSLNLDQFHSVRYSIGADIGSNDDYEDFEA